MSQREFEFDVALSFAGEERSFVAQVADGLRSRGVRFFYDEFQQANLWGKNLYSYFSEVYRQKSRYVVMFASAAYAGKAWPSHERDSAQARALFSEAEYILPCRFDDTEVPGLLPTIHCVDLRRSSPDQLVELICQKLVLAGAVLGRPPFPSAGTSSQSRPAIDAAGFSVSVRDSSGSPVRGTEVLAVAENGTHLYGLADDDGLVRLESQIRRAVTVFCANEHRASHVERSHDSGQDLTVILAGSQGVGSLILVDGTGYIDGLDGRLNPIYESPGRFYLYGTNISINESAAQPVRLAVGELFRLEDAQGRIVEARLIDIIGRSSLIEYRFP